MLPVELLNKYNVLQLLHHGIGGRVWLAEHKGLSCKRVLKAIEKSHPQYEVLAKEASILQQCQHSSIPIIYDILEFDTEIYIVEEYITGENLKQFILRNGTLSVSLLLEFSVQLCEILKFLHNPARPILYLDLKPENILVSNHKLKLIDFGSAIYQNRQEKERFVFGTPQYCAPEMRTSEKLTRRTDLYCLGRCMEYMMYHAKRVPKGYKRIVESCLRKNGKEYTSAQEIAMDLKKIRQNKRKEKTKEIWYAVTGALNEQDGGMVALQMAAYLHHRYKKNVLYLDCSMGSQMEHLERSEKSNSHRGEQSRFVFERNGITVVKRVAPQEADNWRGRGFYFVVCCFGNQHPALSGCLFDGYFYSGAVTEYTLEQWKCCLAAAQKDQNNYLVLTGGDEELAKQEFGHQCRIHKIPTFFQTFRHTKTLGRAWKRLFNGK